MNSPRSTSPTGDAKTLPGSRTSAASSPSKVQPLPEGSPFFNRRDPVGSFKANALGLYDLFGNIAEWVDTPAPDSVGDGNTILYGLRGGSWTTGNARQARPDFHFGIHPGRAQANSGFRIVLDLAMKMAAGKKGPAP